MGTFLSQCDKWVQTKHSIFLKKAFDINYKDKLVSIFNYYRFVFFKACYSFIFLFNFLRRGRNGLHLEMFLRACLNCVTSSKGVRAVLSSSLMFSLYELLAVDYLLPTSYDLLPIVYDFLPIAYGVVRSASGMVPAKVV
ncbi:hypothetical protein EDC96DRAFT_549929 [Choanephora cucurbitarum]|nr:hypothetical protein EDC96DRAFT_549929 [Choanephora cucurbitarum]